MMAAGPGPEGASESKRVVCMCGRAIGRLLAEMLLDGPHQTRFVVNPGEETGQWYRTPRELPIEEIAEDEVRDYDPDVIVVAFYGRILPEEIYGLPRLGCWNLHLGDSERYRGAYPNVWALMNGDGEYAVTLHRVNAVVDGGPILAKRKFPIGRGITGRELYDLMTQQGFQLFGECWDDILSGGALSMTRPQDDSTAVTHYRSELSHSIDVSGRVGDHVRALTFPPFHPPVLLIGGRRYVVLQEGAGDGDTTRGDPGRRS